MHRTKLATCMAAAAITLAGATHLAKPAQAQPSGSCDAVQMAYAQGFADGRCGKGGRVDFCIENSNGGISFGISCVDPT
jgi:hypothetical protein